MSHTSHPLLDVSLCLDSLPSSPPKGEYTRFKEPLLDTVQDALQEETLQEETLLSLVQQVITEHKAVQTSFIIETKKYSIPTIQVPIIDSNETLCEVILCEVI
jgi:hypothetical protein